MNILHSYVRIMELVKLDGKEPVVSTLVIAEGMELEHRAVMQLVDKYRERLEKKWGIVTFEMLKIDRKKRGRPVRYAWLNEEQALFIVTLMQNSDKVLGFKATLVDAFVKQRKLIAKLSTQRQNKAWLEQRELGKVSRKEETDAIQAFVEYAQEHGSMHPDKYYIHFTKATYKALFVVEQQFKEMRNILAGQQLQVLAAADLTVANAIKYGMERNLPYKEIYQLAKERLAQFAALVGKTLVPMQSSLEG